MPAVSYLEEMAASGYSIDEIGPFHRFMVPWLCRQHGIGQDEPIFDIGAGQGHCLIPLAEAGWRNLIAVDIDTAMFPAFKARGIATMHLDMRTERLSSKVFGAGAVFCFHVIEHMVDGAHLVAEACRVLRPGGKLFLVTPDWRKQLKTFWRDPTHVHPYDKEAIERLLRIHGFSAQVSSWGARFGMGRAGLYKRFPQLGMIGVDMLAIGTK